MITTFEWCAKLWEKEANQYQKLLEILPWPKKNVAPETFMRLTTEFFKNVCENSWGWSAVRSHNMQFRLRSAARARDAQTCSLHHRWRWCRTESRCRTEVDIARYHMIELQINLMNISAVTVLLARVVETDTVGEVVWGVEHKKNRKNQLSSKNHQTTVCFIYQRFVLNIWFFLYVLYHSTSSHRVSVSFSSSNGGGGGGGRRAHYVMVSKFQWKPFLLATQLCPQNDWTGWQKGVNYDVWAQAPSVVFAIITDNF